MVGFLYVIKEMAALREAASRQNAPQYFEANDTCQPREGDLVYQFGWRPNRLIARLQGYLLPATCLACGGRGQRPVLDLCVACAAELPLNTQACQRCAIPLQGAEATLCGACLRRAPQYELSYCAYHYAYPIQHFVRGFKYGHSVAHARVLGELLATYLRQHHLAPWPECFIPVPLAAERYRERGYNQATELGRVLERALAMPMRTDVLARTRHTAEQAGLSRRERRKNLRRAFTVTAAELPQHIAILDDVVTTGSTANEIARTLKRAGIKRVEVWAVARVVMK